LDFRFWIEGQENKPMNLSRSGFWPDNRKSKTCGERSRIIPNAKWLGLFAIIVTLVACGARVEAQQPPKIPRIAFLSNNRIAAVSSWNEAFRQGLRDLGYVEGKNIVVDYRFTEGKLDRLSAMAAELVRLRVDVIVTGGPSSTRVAKEATATIPIVMATDPDPVGNGFVVSLARPGGNITGLSTVAREISGKHLELLKEIVPKLFRIAVFGSSTTPGNAETLRETELAAGVFGLWLQYLDVRAAKDIEAAFQAARNERADAVLMLTNAVLNSGRTEISDFAVKSRLPVISGRPEYVEAGGLMSYGVSFSDLHRRTAYYVDKILKGTKPADLPVEQPIKYELIINLKAAKQIGLIIPPNVLARADRVIR
jgi:putative ABC transport system substrate-binding protein